MDRPIEDIAFDEEFDEIPEPTEYPDEPTDYPIGSPERVEVLAKRAAAGRMLYHPLDCGMCADIPVAADAQTYTSTTPGLNVRRTGETTQDLFVSTKIFQVQVVRRLSIDQYDEAKVCVERTKAGFVEGGLEVVDDLFPFRMGGGG